MSISLTSPVTGAAQTGFTTPGYVLTVDQAPAAGSKQWAITSVTGTQTGVDAHSISKPFTIAWFKAAVARVLPQANPITGIIPQNKIGFNIQKIKIRKGMLPAPNQIPMVGYVDINIGTPAGADSNEPEEIRAMLSLAIGALTQMSAGIGDTAVTGVP